MERIWESKHIMFHSDKYSARNILLESDLYCCLYGARKRAEHFVKVIWYQTHIANPLYSCMLPKSSLLGASESETDLGTRIMSIYVENNKVHAVCLRKLFTNKLRLVKLVESFLFSVIYLAYINEIYISYIRKYEYVMFLLKKSICIHQSKRKTYIILYWGWIHKVHVHSSISQK